MGASSQAHKNRQNYLNLDKISQNGVDFEVLKLREGASEELKMALAEKAYAEEARQQAKKQIELAEMEFANAKRLRQQAQAELERAQQLKEQAIKKISSTMSQIICQTCKQQFEASV